MYGDISDLPEFPDPFNRPFAEFFTFLIPVHTDKAEALHIVMLTSIVIALTFIVFRKVYNLSIFPAVMHRKTTS
jgi:hypothetical protein